MGAARSRVPNPEKVIMETFREAGYADGWTEMVLADYVHELAEKIRDEASKVSANDPWANGMDAAADLIDPS